MSGFAAIVLAIGAMIYTDGQNDARMDETVRRVEILERHDEARVTSESVDKIEARVDILADTNSTFDSRITRIEVLLETQFAHMDDRLDNVEHTLSEISNSIKDLE